MTTATTTPDTTTPSTLDAERPSVYSALDTLDALIAAAVRAAEERGYQRGLAERPAGGPPDLRSLLARLDEVAGQVEDLDPDPDAILDGISIDTSGVESVDVPDDSASLCEVSDWLGEYGGRALLTGDLDSDGALDARDARREIDRLRDQAQAAGAVLRDLIRELRARAT